MNSLRLFFFHIIPKNLVSYLFGRFTRIEWPAGVQVWVLRIFIFFTGIKLDEAEKPLAGYRTIEQLFVRKLRPGARTFMGEVLCPCDGRVIVSQECPDPDVAVQVKGLTYRLQDLLVLAKNATASLSSSRLLSVYLAPHNYHRVHSPIRGRLCQVTHVPGELWPVSPLVTRLLPDLYIKNERVIFTIEHESAGLVYVVMVGALNVGSIITPFVPQLMTNAYWVTPETRSFSLSREIAAGDELGTFSLGSTVVCIFPAKMHQKSCFSDGLEGASILCGQSLIQDKGSKP